MERPLPYSRQQIEDDDIAAVVECLRSDFLTTGPRVEEFEAALREATGAEYVVACSNGTAALHLASLTAELKPSDHVIVPAVTFLATANAPHLAGASVTFADVDPDTGLMTVATLAEAMKRAPNARAAFPVHLNGAATDMPALRDLTEASGLMLIEDACHALATTYSVQGQTGTIGDCRFSSMAVFSFHPVKAIAMGEGGAVATNDPQFADHLRRLRNHGMVRSPDRFRSRELSHDASGQLNPWYYEMPEPGFNYRVPDILCALGTSQLKKLDRMVGRRRQLADLYDRVLAPLAPWIRPVPRQPGVDSAFHLYVVLVDFEGLKRSRATVMNKLREEGIFSQVHYTPVHLQPFYRAKNPSLRLPGAEAYYARALSLPLFPGMTDAEVDRVVAALCRATGISEAAAASR